MYEIGDIASVRDPRCIISPHSSWVKCHTHVRLKVELDEWNYSAHEAQNNLTVNELQNITRCHMDLQWFFWSKIAQYMYITSGVKLMTDRSQVDAVTNTAILLHVKYWIMNYIKLYEVRIDLWFILKWVEKTKSYSSLIFFYNSPCLPCAFQENVPSLMASS